MELRSSGGQHDVVGMNVQHHAIGEPNDHDGTRIDTDDVVAVLAGKHRDIATFGAGCGCGSCARLAGPDHHEVGLLSS